MSVQTGRLLLLAVLLLSVGGANGQLVEAARSGDLDALSRLIGQGADVNRREGPDTPLTAAARQGNADVIRLLLAGGANPRIAFVSPERLAGSRVPELKSRYGCANCHQQGFSGLLQGLLDNGRPPTFANLSQRLREHAPNPIAAEDVADVAVWIMRAGDPMAGHTPLEIAAYSCHQDSFPGDPGSSDGGRGERLGARVFSVTAAICEALGRSAGDSRIHQSLENARRDLWYLFDNWAGLEASEGYEAYIRQLDDLKAALDDSSAMSEQDSAALLVEVALELRTKAEDCRKHGAARLAAVSVHTLRSGEEVRGWQVFYISRFKASLPGVEWERFATLSSPAHHSLPPGRYFIAARNGDQDTAPFTVTVGGQQDLAEWQIPVP